MKKMLLNFADQMLSKDQLKKVKGGCGGGCSVCSYSANSGINCGGLTLTLDDAISQASSLNSGGGGGYQYWAQCY